MQTLIISSDVLFCEFFIYEIMLPTQAGSTFSIFNTFHIDASVLNTCFVANTGLSVRVFIDTWAFQNSHSRSCRVHNYRPRPELQTLMATSDVLSMHQQQPKTLQSSSKSPKSTQEQPDSAKSSPDQAKSISSQAKITQDQAKVSSDQAKNCSNQQISSQFRPSSSIGRS